MQLPRKWECARRVQATNPHTLSQEILKELSGPYPVRLTREEYATFLSFLSVVNDAYERGFERIWVCDDDIEFFDDFKLIPKLLSKLTQFDPDWDIFYTDISPRCLSDGRVSHLFSSAYDPRPDQKIKSLQHFTKKFRVSADIMLIRQRTGMHSTILSKNGIKKIRDYFVHVYLWSPLDVDIHYIPEICEYSARKDIVSSWATSPPPLTHAEEEKDPQTSDNQPTDQQDIKHKLFELAQSLQAQNNSELALEAYQKRVALGGDDLEVFWSLYQIAALEQQLQTPSEHFIESYNKAYHFLPTRAEPLYRLAYYYRITANYNLGYLVAKFGLTLDKPNDEKFVEEWIYEWGMLMEYSLCAYYSGHYDEFKYACDEMLSNTNLPDHVHKCVVDNIKLVDLILPPFTG